MPRATPRVLKYFRFLPIIFSEGEDIFFARKGTSMVQNITLTSAMRANLLSLKNTAELLSRTQERLSTGKKVNSPLDNAVNYFAAWSHTSRADDLTARKDNMSEAIQTVKAANDGIKTITTLIESAKGIAQAALATGDLTQRALYVTQYNAILDQVDQLSNDTGYRGTNLLAGGTLTVQFNEDGSSSLDIQGFAATAAGLNIGLVGVAGGVTNWADPTDGMAAINTSLIESGHCTGAGGLGRSDDCHVAGGCRRPDGR
jgi:flagellin